MESAKTLEERILGKVLSNVSCFANSVNITFADDSYLVIHTKALCSIVIETDYCVTECIFNEEKAWMRLGSKSEIEISVDENDLVGPEFYEFRDTDGAWVVANG